jgi:hypothetical protein
MLALIRDGQMIERRDISPDDIPPHKRYLWRPIEYVGEGQEVETTVYDDRVVIRLEPAPEPEPVQDDTSAVIAALVAAQQKADAEISRLKSMLASLAEEAVKE